MAMVRRRGRRGRRQRRKTYIREWRHHRGLTLEQLAYRVGMTHASLSRVERGLQDYTQGLLEALAAELGTDAASLLMRDPTDSEALWSLWDIAQPGQKAQLLEIAKTLLKKVS
jgi:transcriptional regulator with XRE-family HTH domain